MKKAFFLSIFFFLLLPVKAQLFVSVQWGEEKLELEKYYKIGGDSLIFHEFKFYLSDFIFENDEQKELVVQAYLIDLSDINSQSLFSKMAIESFNKMKFRFGMDSVYHVSEIIDGPLNPLNGMYWAWNSGYIQWKCIGSSSVIQSKDHSFEFHLGGYRKPFETMVEMEQSIRGNTLVFNIQPFFEHIVDLKEVQRIMTPGKLAQHYCQELSHYFRME